MILILREVVLHFPELYTPTKYNPRGGAPSNSPEMYRARFALTPDSESYKNVVAARDQLFAETFKSKADIIKREIEYNAQRNCWMDGNKYETTNGFPGHWILSAVRNPRSGAPLAKDRDGKRDVEERENKFYSGTIVNAKVDLWAQEGANSGFRCTLMAVQFVRDGESFGGPAAATADGFDDLGYDGDADDLL